MDRILIIFLYIFLISIMYIDINKKYIPNFLNLILLINAILIRAVYRPESFMIGASIFTLPMLFIYGYLSDFLKKEAVGFGDIKLIIALGGLLFTENINLFLQIYIFYSISFISAALFILFLTFKNIICKNKNNFKNKELAFSPFICLSFFIIYNFSDYIYRYLL